jgi:hydroxylamine dehydrogenase
MIGSKIKIFTVAIVALFAFLGGSSSKLCANPDQSNPCLSCHEAATPGIIGQWRESKHGQAGVECLDCHQAKKTDPDAFQHNGYIIAIIVSPLDCSQCHPTEYAENKGSHHAKAGQILGSLDNLLGEVVGGEPAVNAGCRQCHGGVVKVDAKGRPTADTWPNTGMGRINPDGSWGSCTACHTRHEFSVRQARQPEGCGKCHLGPDHPQIEVWNESKHGVMYHADRESMNLDKEVWRPGVEYFSGPTCASCHMGATTKEPSTHDVGERISWTLRPAISTKLNLVVFEDDTKDDILGDNPVLPAVGSMYQTKTGESKKVKGVSTWAQRRERMQTVCLNCHEKSFVQGAYTQYDDVVNLYNEKFAIPGKNIMDELVKAGKISAAEFDDPIEWTWYEIWHHEGRRTRHGASMQGPDYTWWHGMYEVSKHFYNDFIPQMKEAAGDSLAKVLLDKYVYTHPGNLWYRDGMSKEALQDIQKFYRDRYGQ